MLAKNKKIAIIVSAVVLVAVAAGVFYKFSQKNASGDDLLILKVYDAKLTPAQAQTISQSFHAAAVAIQADPNSFNDWITIGILKKQVNDFDGARVVWEKMAVIRPSSSLPVLNLANLYADFLNDPAKAESYYLMALKNSPDNIQIYTNLADLYKNKLKNKSDKVELLILEGLKNTDNNPSLLAYAGGYFKEIKDYPKALHYFELLYEQKPDDSTIKDEITGLKAKIK